MLTFLAAAFSVPGIDTWMNKKLRDPTSAVVEEMRPVQEMPWKIENGMFKKDGRFQAKLYCLRINARNAYGGYAGFQDFLFVLNEQGDVYEAFNASASPVQEQPVRKYCGKS